MRSRLDAARARVVVSTVLGLIMTLAVTLPAAEVDMLLTKSLSGSQIPQGARYTVQPGDSLYRILRRMGFSGKMTATYRRALESANPKLRDLNLIWPGQVLVIPQESSPEGGASVPSEATAAPVDFAASEGAAMPGDIAAPKAGAPAPAAGPLPAAARLATQALARLGETTQDRGTLFFPIGDLGTLRLESERFPLVNLGSGTVLILDPADAISLPVKALVETTWPRYRLVRMDDARTPEEAIDRLLRESNYYSVARSKELVLGGDVRVTLNCDWLVEKTADSLLDGSVYAVNYARHPREVIPQAIRDYAGRRNIQIVNLPESMEEQYGRGPAPDSSPTAGSLEGLAPADLVDGLLTRLGLPFLTDVVLSLYEEKSPNVGVTYTADRVVEGARRLVVSFREIPPAIASLLTAQDIDHVSLGDGLSPQETVTGLLAGLRLGFTAPKVQFSPPGEDGKDKFTITVPGIYVRANGESFLFTRTTADPQILAFLGARGVRVIRY